MPLFLSTRDTTSREKMDTPDCNPAELKNTYRQFKTINTLISQWNRIYRNQLRPYLQHHRQNNILDIGFGGGDIPMNLAHWAKRDGLELTITAIDPDKRAFEFVRELRTPPNINFIQASSSELLNSGQQYDFVLSNHLLHHLATDELRKMLTEAQQLSHHGVIFNDIRRSDIGYLLFNLLARPVFRNSFIIQDGLTSIQRSYTPQELRKAVPDEWQIQKLFPFRLLLTYYHD